MLASRKYRARGIGWNGKAFDFNITVELHNSNAFQYGNQTCMTMQVGDEEVPRLFDTRYEQFGTKDGFKSWYKWCDEWIPTQFIEGTQFEVIE